MRFHIFTTVCSLLLLKESFAEDCAAWSPDNLDHLSDYDFSIALTEECRYDKYHLPTESHPLKLDLTLIIDHIQEFTIYWTIKTTYHDNMLSFSEKSNRTSILGDEFLKERIWTPQLYVRNAEIVNIENKEKDIVVKISHLGNVMYSYKLVSSFYCKLYLQKFPFDAQKCVLRFTNRIYDINELMLTSEKFEISDSLDFTEYVMDSYKVENDINLGLSDELATSDHRFSELVLVLNFHRDVGFYLFTFFLPSYLLVFTAWVTFWLQADAGPPRAILGTSTTVAFITLHLGLSKEIPKASYVKASDIWFLTISLFIFTSLAEFAFVNVIWRRKKTVELKKAKNKYILKSAIMPRTARRQLRKVESQSSIWSSNSCVNFNIGDGQFKDSLWEEENIGGLRHVQSDATIASEISMTSSNAIKRQTWQTMTPKEVAIWVDRKARILFPICFVLFNIFYWSFVFAF